MVKYRVVTRDNNGKTHLIIMWPFVIALARSVSGTWSDKSAGIDLYAFIDFTTGKDNRGKWLTCILGRYSISFIKYMPQ